MRAEGELVQERRYMTVDVVDAKAAHVAELKRKVDLSVATVA